MKMRHGRVWLFRLSFCACPYGCLVSSSRDSGWPPTSLSKTLLQDPSPKSTSPVSDHPEWH
jgi:hypothetical protein